jgi:hypothetical protein
MKTALRWQAGDAARVQAILQAPRCLPPENCRPGWLPAKGYFLLSWGARSSEC